MLDKTYSLGEIYQDTLQIISHCCTNHGSAITVD